MDKQNRERSIGLISPVSLNDEDRTVDAVLTTEAPARVFDWQTMDFGDEVLLMHGAQVPEYVPLLDTHDRSSVRNVIGSVRGFIPAETSGFKALQGKVQYSDTPEGKSAFQKTKEGHLRDYSVGYKVNHTTRIPTNEKAMIAGREFTGPVSVVDSWTLKEVSAVAIGADQYAKVRSEGIGQAVPLAKTQHEQAGILPAKGGRMSDGTVMETKFEEKKEVYTKAEIDAMTAEITRAAEDQARIAVEQERRRAAEIFQMCNAFGLKDIAEILTASGKTVDEARKEVLETLVKNQPQISSRVDVLADEGVKVRAAMIDGLFARASGQVNLKDATPGYEEFRSMSLVELGRECLTRAGFSCRGLSKNQIAEKLLTRGIVAQSSYDYPKILSAVSNKSLQKAYAEAPQTWRPFVNVISADDFKDIYRLNFSESPGLLEIEENGEYKETTFSESQETFALKTWGILISITRKMLVNDDLSAFARIPAEFGKAAKRKESDIVYSVITTNGLMADGVALFASGHSNYHTSGDAAAITSESLSKARALIAKQTGLKGAVLDIIPKFLLCPLEKITTAEVLLQSAALPTAEYSSAIYNPWEGKLIPIADPRLSANSTTAWYLVADPAQIGTIDVAYLDGNQAPTLSEEEMFERDAVRFKIRHDFNAAPIEYRGMYKNTGA
jgi:phage major head subunit gpT-like protein